MSTQALKRNRHSVYRLTYYLVVETKNQYEVLNPEMLDDLQDYVENVCKKWGCEVIELEGRAERVHILFEGHPNMELATFVNNLKTVTSRRLRKKYGEHLSVFYSKPTLWSNSYCLISTGGANLETLKDYLDSQDSPLDKNANVH